MTLEPRNMTIALPFPREISPDAGHAHRRSLAWIREQKLANDETVRYFAAMRMAEFAARWWPRARGDDLDLLAELVCWLSFHDDEADSAEPARASVARQTCADLLDAVAELAPVRPLGVIATAWVDLW